MHLTVPKAPAVEDVARLSRVPKVKSTIRGIIVMANEVAHQRACSEWVGYSKYQPMKCRPLSMKGRR